MKSKPINAKLSALESMVESLCIKHDCVFDLNHKDEFYLYSNPTDTAIVCGTEYETALHKAIAIMQSWDCWLSQNTAHHYIWSK